MPINPIPQPVDVIINPSGEPPKIKDFIINAPLIVQSTNVKNKLDTITKETDNLSTRLSALESSIDSNITNITNISSNASGSFFFSNSPNIIETSGSLYLSGAIKSSYISSSTGAYITGSVTQGYSENIASGMNSHAEGRQTRAQGIGSHAEGYGGDGYASGDYSHAEGQATIAYGDGSHAEGYQTNASGDYCHTEGQDTYVTINGDWGHAEGHLTKVDNCYAHTEGYGTLTSGIYSHAEGYLATGSGQGSHAEGLSTTAQGYYSHAEGEGTTAVNYGSHTEGVRTRAGSNGSHIEGYESYSFAIGSPRDGLFAHAEGYQTSVCGDASHAEGYQTHASGAHSHAEGDSTVAYGEASHAGGHGTIASGSYQTVFGSYNKRLNTTSLFAIGNGTGDSDTLRNDIFRAESTGELVLSGGIRQNARFVTSTSGGQTHNLTRNDYIFILYTASHPNTVYLPKITNTVTDIGLTVIIRQHDTVGNAVGVTITSHADNAGYVIIGFDNVGSSIITNSGGVSSNPNRSVMLTFVGTIPANGAPGTWVVISNSLC